MALLRTGPGAPLGFLILMATQCFCAASFVVDVIEDYEALGPMATSAPHLSIEAVATLSLIAAIAVEAHYLRRLLRRKADLEHSLAMARSAVSDAIEAHFDAWKLSPSERDVATFLVKGLSTAEIAALRGRAEGTIKAHLNAIYRKSGVRNRAEMLSLLIDSLMGGDAEAVANSPSAA